MAIKYQCVEKGLVFHSDRGIQYASKKFTNMIDSYKMITRSMSRKGNCWDNALAKIFLRLLKRNKFMVIPLYQKRKCNLIYLNLLKFGTTEKEGTLL
jgi:putative transposase